MNRLARFLTALALCACAASATAGANEYRVYACKLPDGRPAPADGWTPTGSAPYAWFDDGCPAGGALRAGIAGEALPANASSVGWGFNSGPAAIESYSLVRSGRIAGYATGVSTLLYSSDAQNIAGGGYSIDYCAAFDGCTAVSGRLDRAGAQIPAGSRAWYFMVGCGGISGNFCVRAPGSSEFGSIRIDSAVFNLSDDEQPRADAASGSLTENGASSGDLSFIATDEISGIHRAAIEVDGEEFASVHPNTNGGRCERIGLAGALNDFKYRQPCPARQQVELSLEQPLPVGRHTIRARVYDAAGNGLTVFGPRTVAVGAAQASGAAIAGARIDSDTAASRTVSYGRTVTFSGTLRNSSGPVAGAGLTATLTSPSAAKKTLTQRIVTDEAGRYRFAAKATATRSVALLHDATGASLQQALTVRSRLKLRAKRARVRALGRMQLSGRIPTAPTRRRPSVAIKVRSGRSWRTIGVVRASTRGAFSFSYRFRRTRDARLTFRAVALKSSDLAVSARASKSVRIRVG